MALQERYDAAVSIITEHNQAMGPVTQKNVDTGPAVDVYPDGYVNPTDFLTRLKLLGGTSEERLKGLSFEEILTILPVVSVMMNGGQGTPIKPTALAKDIARVFRGKEEPAQSGPKGYVSAKKVERMLPRELIEAFDPEEFDNAVGRRLKEATRNEPFLVYSDEGTRTIDLENTLKLFMEVKKGFGGRDNIQVASGDIRKVFRVGELPDDLVDENPLYRGRPLRPDGTCDQTGRSWDGVTTQVRQLIRLIVESGAVTVSIDKSNDLIDMAIDTDGWRKLFDRYQAAAVKFRELEKSGNLPKLKMALKTGRPGPGPLPVGRRVNPGQ